MVGHPRADRRGVLPHTGTGNSFPAGRCLLLPATAQSQVSVGVSGGLAFSDWSGDDVDDDDFDRRTGLLGGGFVNVPLADIVSLTSGLYYVQKGASDGDPQSDATFKLDYVEIPALLQVAVGRTERAALSVFAGPRLSFEAKCEFEGEDNGAANTFDCDAPELEQFDITLETRGVTFGGIFGAGAQFMTSETTFFLLNGGLDLGLTSIDDSDLDADVKNSSWFLQAGVGWVVGT